MNAERKRTLGVVGAQAIAQLSVIAVIPLITRQYAAEEVGWYQLATAIAMTLQPLATLRVEFAIPSTQHEANVRTLMRSAMGVTFGLSGGLVAAALIAYATNAEASAAVLAMTGLLVAGFSWTAIDNARLIRLDQTQPLALRNLSAGVIAAVLQIVAIFVAADVVFLAAAILIARLIAMSFTRGDRRLNASSAGIERAPYTFKRGSRSVLSGLVASATGQVLVFGAGLGYGAAASAYVGLAQRAAGTPLTLLGQGLAQVMQGRIAPLIREGRNGLVQHIRQQVLWLSVLSSLTAVALIVLAPILAVPLLGEGWQMVGTITAILAVPLSFQLLVGPLMTILPMLAREGLLLVLQICRLTLVVAAVVGGMLAGADLIQVSILYGIATVIGYVAMLIVVIVVAGDHDRRCTGD